MAQAAAEQWPEDRVKRLETMWPRHSASQIASELGVSRNAVIGKVHRLGLSGRAKVAARALADRPRVQPAAEPPEPAPVAPTAAMEEPAPSVPVPAPPPAAAAPIPFATRVTIMELRDSMCRWPLGDPSSADFRYCGSRSGPLGPYCEEHARLAFQPTLRQVAAGAARLSRPSPSNHLARGQ